MHPFYTGLLLGFFVGFVVGLLPKLLIGLIVIAAICYLGYQYVNDWLLNFWDDASVSEASD